MQRWQPDDDRPEVPHDTLAWPQREVLEELQVALTDYLASVRG